jgi:hypothetical protein
VGCIPPLKALLYSPRPPLRVLSEALDTLGAGLIPTTIPLLGAVLYRLVDAAPPGLARGILWSATRRQRCLALCWIRRLLLCSLHTLLLPAAGARGLRGCRRESQ